MIIIKTLFTLSFFKYLFSFSYLKFFCSFFYSFFHHIFFTKSSLFFGFNVGWDNNFLVFFNFFKIIIVFIWNKLIFLLPFLKIFEFFFNAFLKFFDIFKNILNDLLKIFSNATKILDSDVLMGLTGVTAMMTFTSLVSKFGGAIPFIGNTVEKITKPIVNSYEKTLKIILDVLLQVIIFTFKIMIVIGNLLVTFLFKVLEISLYLFKIWFFILKKVIMILSFVLYFLALFIYFYAEKEHKQGKYLLKKGV
ncbi:hypothetical protein [Vaccinium witches'-broom phytoplasma]|uniref:hypothetical protein n=1 Tax=Vaccinium witches'-broom phytoplasma TaxID=85642 RepID=UPI0003726260|nr:hypothetical protein [Vaccinium witches'-broom phytoplasma]